MSRATIKPRLMRAKLGIRDAIWSGIRKRRTFTVPELSRDTKLSSRTVQEFVRALATAGYIAQKSTVTCSNGHGVTLWHMVLDTGVEPPAITKAGTKSTSGRTRDQLWRTMKMLTEFEVRDLALHASTDMHPITVTAASEYAHQLHRASYLIRTRERQRNSRFRYRLLPSKNTGPRAPRVVVGGPGFRNWVYDPNTGKLIEPGGSA